VDVFVAREEMAAMKREILIPFTMTMALGLGCSGSGVSTTARTDDGMGAGMDGGTADDGGSDPTADDDGGAGDDADDGGGTSSAPDPSAGDDGPDPTADDGGSDSPSADDAADDGTPEEVTLAGSWVSEGSDVAPLLVELTGAQKITAVFADDTFTVATIDDQGQEVIQAGVYSATPSGVGQIFDIVLEQSSPATVTAEGIFEIDTSVSPAVMRYEIVQTEPSVGAIAPTAEGGFGSTAYGDDLTQVYLRQ
jgi:hypothetical protein